MQRNEKFLYSTRNLPTLTFIFSNFLLLILKLGLLWLSIPYPVSASLAECF